jgi:CRP-like cAMP-binding protein
VHISRTPRFLTNNRILDLLPHNDYERFLPHLEPVRLISGKILYMAGDKVGHAYFPLGGMLSLVSTTESGDATEVGMIGNEGMAGLPIILKASATPYQITVQLPMNAMRVKSEVVRTEFNRGGALQDLLLRYTQAMLTQISQSAACNRFHSVEERLCRWLLTSRDRVNSNSLQLTQEFLSQMIGAPRSSVTAVAGALQRAGMLHYYRGKIQIINPEGLKATACECYTFITEEISQLFAA